MLRSHGGSGAAVVQSIPGPQVGGSITVTGPHSRENVQCANDQVAVHTVTPQNLLSPRAEI
jgi:hypothetical protein